MAFPHLGSRASLVFTKSGSSVCVASLLIQDEQLERQKRWFTQIGRARLVDQEKEEIRRRKQFTHLLWLKRRISSVVPRESQVRSRESCAKTVQSSSSCLSSRTFLPRFFLHALLAPRHEPQPASRVHPSRRRCPRPLAPAASLVAPRACDQRLQEARRVSSLCFHLS